MARREADWLARTSLTPPRPTPPLPLLGITYIDQPMLFRDNAALRGPPPPDITSARFRAEVEEVRRMGGAGDRTRTEADLTAWRAARGAAGRMPPNGFPRDNGF